MAERLGPLPELGLSGMAVAVTGLTITSRARAKTAEAPKTPFFKDTLFAIA